MIVEQVDIVRAYLKSLLTNNDLHIFMKLVLRIEVFRSIRAVLVARLMKIIYELRQSGRL